MSAPEQNSQNTMDWRICYFSMHYTQLIMSHDHLQPDETLLFSGLLVLVCPVKFKMK